VHVVNATEIFLGKLKVEFDDRTLPFMRYGDRMPVPPSAVPVVSPLSPWGMLLNDGIGDCTIAAQCHQEQSWRAQLGIDLPFTDPEALDAYETLTHYDPSKTDAQGNNPTDTGASCLAALRQWRSKGISGHKIHAYAAIDVHDVIQAQQCIWGFGGMYLGLDMPVSAQAQVQNNQLWDVVTGAGQASSPGSWGGHCVCVVGYDQIGPYAISWGGIYQMSWRFFSAYCDEAYAVIGKDQLDQQKETVLHWDWKQLEADLTSLKEAAAV
jgi:hypothetical protein